MWGAFAQLCGESCVGGTAWGGTVGGRAVALLCGGSCLGELCGGNCVSWHKCHMAMIAHPIPTPRH